ncbi:MAG: protein-export membrane protein SecF [Candidatus Vogelbacteria bacterium RIFOXYD1_FULL_46_19]|uniref:Protein-export membrane protein SecF n=1 Tax=Candidatus Vogelbacteria bacterium RIFOXYD1_FULL_46_19 TaxID=1802439 RepID=A0A1G2QGD3_9BACT|nr:MAG: protein-export membrane protein SecF [Candidatus Vogelbacteria bacterium RIFOXYD1_FULL_46_19]
MFVIKHRRKFFAISALVVGLAVAAILYFGLNFGTDFTGGSILELRYPEGRPTAGEIKNSLATTPFAASQVQPAGDSNVILRLQAIDEAEKEELISTLAEVSAQTLTEERFSSIGPTISGELARRAGLALVIVVILIVLFIAFVFRHVSEPVSSWKYGLVAVLTLLHDIIIPTGVFAVLGYLYGVEIDALFLTAMLTILGLSVNDTIVVFDRIRENLKNKVAPHFEDVVGLSLQQTYARSINTSLTIIVVLLALYIFGGTTTKDFALALTIGMTVGTYSSIFLAAPLLVTWDKWSSRRG